MHHQMGKKSTDAHIYACNMPAVIISFYGVDNALTTGPTGPAGPGGPAGP